MKREQLSQKIKAHAKALGFMSCGISEATFLEEEAPRLERWLKGNMHGEMAYMENHFDKRLDPRLLVEGARSVISLLLNYYQEPLNGEGPKISRYALGEDYHFVIKRKLKELLGWLQVEVGEVKGRAFVDSAPVLDKAWAKRSGLGWVGKNSNLITPSVGSYYFIAELIVDLPLEYDSPINDYCGTCTRCIDACPTQAIVQPYVVDGSKCISYATIELKNSIPDYFLGKMDDWMFGCDVCQEVCPWNRFSTPHQEPAFEVSAEMKRMNRKDWMEITEEVFQSIAKKSPMKRPGYAGLKRNIAFLSKGAGAE
jgi:epoxyqueuosine reductase